MSRDVVALAAEMERTHPDLYADAAGASPGRDEGARRAPSLTRAELTVGLMRLVALAGRPA